MCVRLCVFEFVCVCVCMSICAYTYVCVRTCMGSRVVCILVHTTPLLAITTFLCNVLSTTQ